MPRFGNIKSQVVTNDLYTFVINNRSAESYDVQNIPNDLIQIDYTGDIVASTEITGGTHNNSFVSSSLHIDSDENIVVYNQRSGSIEIYNPNDIKSGAISTVVSSGNGNNNNDLILDLSGNYILGEWFSAAVDNDNYLYTIETVTSNELTALGFVDGSELSYKNDGSETVFEQITSVGYTNVCYRYNLNVISTTTPTVYYVADDSNIQNTREVLTFTNDFYEQIQFKTLYPNNFQNGIISKPFNPQSLAITRENDIIITNDANEILKLEINKNKPVRFVSHSALLDNPIATGYNFIDLTNSGIPESQYKKHQTETYWTDVSSKLVNTTTVNFTYEYNDITSQYETFYWIIDSNNKSVFKTDNNYLIRNCFSLPEGMDSIAYTGETYSQYSFTLPPETTYNWHRKYNWIPNGQKDTGFKASVFTLTDGSPVKHTLEYSVPLVNKQFYNLSLVYDQDDNELNFYVDNVLVDNKSIPENSPVYYSNKAGGVIGANPLKSNALNSELDCNIYSFHGAFYDIRMYATALTHNQLSQIMLSNLKIQPIDWHMPIGVRQYVEQIERFFMNRFPGHASTLYKIRLIGLNITDPSIRTEIEDIIYKTVEKVAPAYTSLYEIEWI